MNNRTGLYVLGGMAAVAAIMIFVIAAAWGSGIDAESAMDAGSLLHPRVVEEARPGYVLAELYQDVHLDVESGVYDQDGELLSRYWNHEPTTQTCSVDLTVADQHGRTEASHQTPTPAPLDVVATYSYGVGGRLEGIHTTHATPTPAPDAPTPVPPPLESSTTWHGWKGRPLAIEADRQVLLDTPRDALVSAHLSVRTGAHSGHGSHVELARMPLPDADWSDGSTYLRLSDASGRILLASDTIDANYRSAVLHVEVAPLSGCGDLRLRWQRPAAVVVKALTNQPFIDWTETLPSPPTPVPPAPALYASVGPDGRFDGADLRGGVSSSVPGHVVIPDAQADSHVAFAIRADLIPNGLSDVRQTGSPFNARDAFAPAVGNSAVILDVGGTEYKLYVSRQPWRAELLGGEWSLR